MSCDKLNANGFVIAREQSEIKESEEGMKKRKAESKVELTWGLTKSKQTLKESLPLSELAA